MTPNEIRIIENLINRVELLERLVDQLINNSLHKDQK